MEHGSDAHVSLVARLYHGGCGWLPRPADPALEAVSCLNDRGASRNGLGVAACAKVQQFRSRDNLERRKFLALLGIPLYAELAQRTPSRGAPYHIVRWPMARNLARLQFKTKISQISSLRLSDSVLCATLPPAQPCSSISGFSFDRP